MKKTHIIGLVAIALAIGALVISFADFDSFTSFSEAIKFPDKNHQIVGHLSEGKEKVVYNPEVDPNSFSFYMKDEKGIEKKVICKQEKPQDFERSEQIVVTGRMDIANDQFIAHAIQLKCPSKYQDEALQNANLKISEN